MIPTTETFDTTAVHEGARVRYWNSAARDVFDAIEVEPASRHFIGRMRRRLFGAVQLATVDSTPVAIHGRRSAKLNGVYLMTHERGSCTVLQRGRQTRLQAGELTVLCAHEPYRLECSREHRTHVLYVPGRGLDRELDAHIGSAHGGEESALLSSFIARLDRIGPAQYAAGNLLDTTLSLIRLTWPAPAAVPARANAAAWRERLLRHIDQHLGDPDLGADSMAGHFGISSRYVQMIFAGSGTSVSQHILERRLQTVPERLQHEPQARIGDAALDAGFSDVSHFCRCFRARFGVSARDYRAGLRRA
jgi:AraC-like DNA-binding protein